jgi:uncharacterized membrane protein HdeD (DUF308 family)
MSKITKRFSKVMFLSLGVSILDIIVGMIFIVCASLAIKTNAVILGSTILIHGLFYVIRYLYDGLGKKVFAVDLIAGVAAVILGIFTIFNTFDSLSILGPMFCVWMIISGLEKLYFGVIFMKKQEDIYPLVTFISILFLALGVIAFINPFKLFMVISRLVGLFIICAGLLEIMICMLFRKRAKYILNMFK